MFLNYPFSEHNKVINVSVLQRQKKTHLIWYSLDRGSKRQRW